MDREVFIIVCSDQKMANRTNRKKLKYVKGPRYMTEFCYGSLINFYVVLSL